MNICVIGTGYVGLVTGTVFADLGNDVVCVDVDPEKVAMLRRGEMPIYEPGLEEMVEHNVSDGRLSFTTDTADAVKRAEVVFLCVGTPPKPSGEPDMQYVLGAAKAVAQSLNGYKIVVNKSTVPVGTGDMVRQVVLAHRASTCDFDVVSNPEFLREGSAISDTLNPDRIVIGAPNHRAGMKILELYAPLGRPALITDVASAEMIKYASNAFLATKISFINAIANLCDACGADVVQVQRGMGADARIGSAFLQAGLGYGGSCFPKDTLALISTAERFGADPGILKEVVKVNQGQPSRFVQRLAHVLGGLEGRQIAVLGLAFKPNTDDLRESRALDVIHQLLESGAAVTAYDPIANEKAKPLLPQVAFAEGAYEAAEGADAVVLVTEWNEFKQLNLDRLREAMRGNVVFDGRNLYNPHKMRRHGFVYYGVGRAAAASNKK